MSSSSLIGIEDSIESEDELVLGSGGCEGLGVAVDELSTDSVLQQAIIHDKPAPSWADIFPS